MLVFDMIVEKGIQLSHDALELVFPVIHHKILRHSQMHAMY
jgi:hypothetical protein